MKPSSVLVAIQIISALLITAVFVGVLYFIISAVMEAEL